MMFLAAALLSAVQMAATPNECSADPAAVQRVTAVANEIIDADNARDLGRVKASYAADAVLMPPNEAPVQGWTAIQPRYEALFAGFDPAIVGHLDQVCVSGRIAYLRGRNTGQMRGRGGNASRTLNDAYVMLLRLEPGGRWRISHLIWHSAGPG